jgi:hypothetical protein
MIIWWNDYTMHKCSLVETGVNTLCLFEDCQWGVTAAQKTALHDEDDGVMLCK